MKVINQQCNKDILSVPKMNLIANNIFSNFTVGLFGIKMFKM